MEIGRDGGKERDEEMVIKDKRFKRGIDGWYR